MHEIWDNFLNSAWIYPMIFVCAFLEGFVFTTFFFNGTIAIVGIGALIGAGYVNPFWAIPCIYIGTLAGDSLNFALSARIQSVPMIVRQLDKVETFRSAFQHNPFIITIVSHTVPNLKSLSSLFAGGAVPWRNWFAADLCGAAIGTCLYVGLGITGSRIIEYLNTSYLVIIGGVLFLVYFIYRRIKVNSICKMPRRNGPTIFCPKHRLRKRLFFLFWFPFWHPVRWFEGLLRQLPSRSLRRDLEASFPDVRAGDIFLIRLHSPAPWGRWAHSAISISPDCFCHGFGKVITEHRLGALPIRYAIAHLRVECDDKVAKAAATAAAEMIGKKVAILAKVGDVSKFSCAGLIEYAYRSVGIELVPRNIKRVIPDDLLNSPHVRELRVVYTEHTKLIKSERRHAILSG